MQIIFDQMVQAARSGKQNLAEGNIDGITSREMELKLTNVNRASLHELLIETTNRQGNKHDDNKKNSYSCL